MCYDFAIIPKGVSKRRPFTGMWAQRISEGHEQMAKIERAHRGHTTFSCCFSVIAFPSSSTHVNSNSPGPGTFI